MEKKKILVPGSCGELVQGTVGGIDFLVSCPINLYTEAKFIPDSSGAIKTEITKEKTKKAIQKTAELLQMDISGCLEITSQLPEGKGMASSTADIAAACWAVAESYERNLSEFDVARIALEIEPSDGIMFPKITMLDHRNGRMVQELGVAPPIGILIFDLGGKVDTLDFNNHRDLDKLNSAKEEQVKEALILVQNGIKNHDGKIIAEGSTISALAHQAILPKPDLEKVIQEVKALGAWGINTAHSGTVIGILADPEKTKDVEWQNKIENTLSKKVLANCQMINGGKRYYAD